MYSCITAVYQKLTQHCKSVIFQLKKINTYITKIKIKALCHMLCKSISFSL